MSSFFNCVAYDDVATTMRLGDHVVFLALKIKGKDSDMHITFNPLQVRILVKYLTAALSQINFTDLAEEKYFGDMSVQIELEPPTKLDFGNNFSDDVEMYEEEYAVAVPF